MLRDYQIEQVESAEILWRQGAHSCLVESATGTGKTIALTEVVRRESLRGGRSLVIAHRRELVDQVAAKSREAGLSVTVERGRVMATGGESVVCSSVQTMSRRLFRFEPDEFSLVVVDECHHAPAASYLELLAHFPRARVLGVTATPDRADGVSLGLAFEHVAARYGVAEAVAEGYLVPARGVVVEVPGMDLSKVRLRIRKSGAGDDDHFTDLHPADLGRAAIAPEAVEGISGPLVELAGARRTVVFAVDRRHARALVASLRARGKTAAWVDGSLPAETRKEVIRGHREGVVQFLCNVGILCEGYDDPRIECVAMCRPTQSRVTWSQCVGRGLRPCPEISKTECLVLDFVGASCQHDLVGPEDVLAGAMVGPVTRVGKAAPPLAPLVEYVPPQSWRQRFATRVVSLMRRTGRRVARIVRALVG